MTLASPVVVVLDRDGVINHESVDFIKSPDEWHPLPGSLNAIARLCEAGFTIAVATNQSGVGRGLFSLETLQAIHRKMVDSVAAAGGAIAHIAYCPHSPEAHCECRKPSPGMLYEIAERFGCGFANMVVIGDAARDLQAAQTVGARSILVRTGKGRSTEAQLTSPGIGIYNDLAAASDALISEFGIRSWE